MNIRLAHDSFCRDVLSDVPTFMEFVDYLAKNDIELRSVIDLLDLSTFERIPDNYSDTVSTGYADLAFRAFVKAELLKNEVPVQVCVGFLVEHKSWPDDSAMEQLRRYHYHLMVEKMKINGNSGIPSIAIILYNGKDKWNPLEEQTNLPKALQNIVLPFKCVFVDVDSVSDEQCLDALSPRLGAIICTLKYARDPNAHRDVFKKVLERLGKISLANGTLDLITSMDVYLHKWLSTNFEEVIKVDFIRAPYKTLEDLHKERIAESEAKLAESEAKLAESEAKLAKSEAKIAESEAKIAKSEAKIAESEVKLAENEAKLAELEARNSALEAELAALKAQK